MTPVGSSSDNSVHAPVSFNAPLLTQFRKVKFAQYTLTSTIPLFPNTRNLIQYECGSEFHAATELVYLFSSCLIGVGAHHPSSCIFPS